MRLAHLCLLQLVLLLELSEKLFEAYVALLHTLEELIVLKSLVLQQDFICLVQGYLFLLHSLLHSQKLMVLGLLGLHVGQLS
jgi:hypothetical protein